jgi:transcriptional regulator with XRE-family HTH domain
MARKQPGLGDARDERILGPAERRTLAQQFGARVRELRLAAGLTPDELGAHCGMVSQTISKIESGRLEPRVSQIVQLCQGLDVTPKTLLGGLIGPGRTSHTRRRLP